jgi:hypothetical protein
MKKTKEKSKTTAKKPAKKRAAAKSKKPADMVQARENISDLVRASSGVIANKVIEVAKTGALASAKYLFEVAGLYPATEATAAKPEDNSLAHTFMQRLNNLPEPAVEREEDAEDAPEDETVTAGETVKVNAAQEDCPVEGETGKSAE